MFTLSGVYKTYGAVEAVRGVDLKIEPGKTTALIGPSGCGKSTLLRLMIGLAWPDAGDVTFNGNPVLHANVAQIRRKVGYVIQEGGLFPHLTALNNVTLMARYLGWARDAIEQRVADLALRAQLELGTLRRFPSELSGGQRQRVSLMRALMLDPEVLLLDEPLGALDPMIRYDLQQDLKQLFQQLRKTVVLVTHDIGEAGFFADTLVLLRDSQIVQQGTLHELVHDPQDVFVERFITAQRAPLSVIEETA